MAGGLATPRPPAEIQYQKTADQVLNHQAKVMTVKGDDVTAQLLNPELGLLKIK